MREKTGHPTKTRESSSYASFFLAFITSKSLLKRLPENYFVYPTRVFLINVRGISGSIREIKIHVYSIRQTANVSGEFLRIENKQLKKVQNDSCGQNYHKTTYFCVEAINGKRKIGGKLGHVVQIHVCRLA